MTAPTLDRPSLHRFFASLPHRVADAGLDTEGAERLADRLEDLVQAIESANHPRGEASGPDPDSFPPPSNRIAAAANDLGALLDGLGEEGWDEPVPSADDEPATVQRRLQTDYAALTEDFGLEGATDEGATEGAA